VSDSFNILKYSNSYLPFANVLITDHLSILKLHWSV